MKCETVAAFIIEILRELVAEHELEEGGKNKKFPLLSSPTGSPARLCMPAREGCSSPGHTTATLHPLRAEPRLSGVDRPGHYGFILHCALFQAISFAVEFRLFVC